AAVSRPAWVYTPAAQEVVDKFGFSALAPVRPTIALFHTLRCPRMFVSVKRDALDLGDFRLSCPVCFASWGLQRYSYRHEVPQDLAAAVSGNPQDQKAVRR